MKNYLYLIMLLASVFSVCAQNYSPIVNGNNSLFQSEADGNLYAMHVDSNKTESGKDVFYFLKAISLDNNCYSTDYESGWTGPRLVKDGNAYYFFNKNEDSIKLLPLQPVGASWELYKYTDGSYIEATVASKDFVSILALADSVKTISLQLKDASNADVTNAINGKTILLSKNYGVVSLPAFVGFPSTYPIYTLVGLSSPYVGYQLPTPRKIYDFNVGDEFHYEESYTNPPTTNDIKRVIKVTNKYVSANTDTVKYTMSDYSETTTHHYFPSAGPDTYSYALNEYNKQYVFNDSIIYPANYLFSTVNGYQIQKNSLKIANDPNGKIVQNIFTLYVTYDQDCGRELVDGFTDNLDLLEGVGKFYHSSTPGMFFNTEQLVYYKKGNETWGTSVTLSAYSKKASANLSLFPNPLKQGEQLKLQTENFQTSQLIIYNNLGTRVLDYNSPDAAIESVDVATLPSGLYVIQLLNNNNEFISAKFIIK